MTRRTRATGLTVASCSVAGWILACLSIAAASATAPPSTEPTAPGTPTTTEPTGTFESGVYTAPDGSFTARFGGPPHRSVDSLTGVTSFLHVMAEDSESVELFPRTALGATADSAAAARAELFLVASGSDIEYLANTPTNLGPFPASHFAARVTLADERRATVYGVLVDRGDDIAYAFYTDIGGDDNAAAVAFVQSFAIVLQAPPLPTTSGPTTSSVAQSGAPTTTAPTTTAPNGPPASTAPATTTSPPPPAVVEAPAQATLGFDGRWWVEFPPAVAPTFRASTQDGFGFAEYLAMDGDDTLVVRVTEVPPGYEWNAEQAPAAAAKRDGGAVRDSATIDVDGHPAVRFTLAPSDSDTSGAATVEALVVDGGDRIYSVEYRDRGVTSTDAANRFIASFGLAPG